MGITNGQGHPCFRFYETDSDELPDAHVAPSDFPIHERPLRMHSLFFAWNKSIVMENKNGGTPLGLPLHETRQAKHKKDSNNT